jgi:tripartite-type tricarboxylate transporter receptor subunit TctC
MNHYDPSRRRLLAGTAAALALGPSGLRAQAYPSKNFRVVIPTAQGGGAERLARSFDEVWSKLLKTNFEYSFYAGAAGQVGYETFIHRRDRDGHELLFGNMGPETIMYVLQEPDYDFPGDYIYFMRTNVDDSTLFVRADSPFRHIEEVVEEAQTREVTVSTSRLPHPASIGTLALAEETGAQFHLIPYGGGGPTSLAVINEEVDCGILPSVVPIRMGEDVRVLAVWSDENAMAHLMGDPPSVNEVFGTDIPDLPSAWGWAIHTEVVENHPDRYERLVETLDQALQDPALREATEATGTDWGFFQPGDRDAAMSYANNMVELTRRYQDVLAGS